jgi:hypothetical protein
LVFVVNEEGRQAYLHHDRLQRIFIPGLQQVCQDTNQITTLFSNGTASYQNKTLIESLGKKVSVERDSAGESLLDESNLKE